jgi:predicted Zn-dependent peptidase
MYESADEIGVAHFLEHITFDGTEKYPDDQKFAAYIEDRGGFRGASTSKETIEYVAKVLKEDAEIAFDCLSQMVIHPLVREEDIQKEKKIIEQEIYRFKNNPEDYAPRLMYSALFPGTRMGALNTGDVDDIKKISRLGIVSYLNKTHCARNAVLSVCGNISEDHLRNLITTYFGNMKSGEKIPFIDVSVMPKKDPLFETRQGLKQAVVAVGYQGFTTGDSRHYAADLLSRLLVRGKSSRLNYEIRERRALAYTIQGGNNSDRNSGTFTIRVGMAEEKISECFQVIREELKKIASEPILQNELEKALALVTSNIAFSFENSLAEASYHSDTWCSTGTVQTVNEELAEYKKVAGNPSLMQEVATKLFSPDPAVLVISGKNSI